MHDGLCKGGAAPAGARAGTRCSRRQSPPSSPSRARGTQLVGERRVRRNRLRNDEGWAAGRGRGHTGARIHENTHCRCKSLLAPRASLVSGGAQGGGRRVGSRGARSESSSSRRATQVTQPFSTLQPRVSGAPPSYLRPRLPPSSAPPFFSTLFSILLLFSSPGPLPEPHVGAEPGMPPFQPIVTWLPLYWPSPCRL